MSVESEIIETGLASVRENLAKSMESRMYPGPEELRFLHNAVSDLVLVVDQVNHRVDELEAHPNRRIAGQHVRG